MITLKELQESWAVDCKIDELELGKATIKTAELHSKYLNHLSNFKLQLRKSEGAFYKLRIIKQQYGRGELSKQELETLGWDQWLGNKPLKNDMAEMVESDDDLQEQMNKVEYIRTVVDFLDRVMRSLHSRTWDIKNGIEWTKFTNGLM
jgi:hypothetical protein